VATLKWFAKASSATVHFPSSCCSSVGELPIS